MHTLLVLADDLALYTLDPTNGHAIKITESGVAYYGVKRWPGWVVQAIRGELPGGAEDLLGKSIKLTLYTTSFDREEDYRLGGVTVGPITAARTLPCWECHADD